MLEEIVVQPVEDEQRDEDEGQDDDGDEAEGQAGLEGFRGERAQAPPEWLARAGRFSVRRMRSRLP